MIRRRETPSARAVAGHFIRRLVGFSSRDSQDIFNILQKQVIQLENTVRWFWRPGDIAVWDNRSTQHYAVDDYADQPRLLTRTTLAGDVPISVDGRHSIVRKGDASHFSPVVSLV